MLSTTKLGCNDLYSDQKVCSGSLPLYNLPLYVAMNCAFGDGFAVVYCWCGTTSSLYVSSVAFLFSRLVRMCLSGRVRSLAYLCSVFHSIPALFAWRMITVCCVKHNELHSTMIIAPPHVPNSHSDRLCSRAWFSSWEQLGFWSLPIHAFALMFCLRLVTEWWGLFWSVLDIGTLDLALPADVLAGQDVHWPIAFLYGKYCQPSKTTFASESPFVSYYMRHVWRSRCTSCSQNIHNLDFVVGRKYFPEEYQALASFGVLYWCCDEATKMGLLFQSLSLWFDFLS